MTEPIPPNECNRIEQVGLDNAFRLYLRPGDRKAREEFAEAMRAYGAVRAQYAREWQEKQMSPEEWRDIQDETREEREE